MSDEGYDNNLSGVLFPNGYKKRDNQPDWTGTFEIDGEEWRLAAWNKTSRNGKEFLSLALTRPEDVKAFKAEREARLQAEAEAKNAAALDGSKGGLDEDTPF